MDTTMTLGQRIQTLRKGMSRDKFAPLTGISKNTLVNYEKNERVPGADYLNKLLALLPDTNPAWLLTGEGNMKLENTGKRSMKRENREATGGAARTQQGRYPEFRILEPAEMDSELIWKVLETIHNAAKRQGVELSDEKRLAIQTLVYVDAIHKDRKPNEAYVDILVKLAS